jgi:hypothetical protein
MFLKIPLEGINVPLGKEKGGSLREKCFRLKKKESG